MYAFGSINGMRGISDVTNAERLLLDLSNYAPPIVVETTDNGAWKWLGGSTWVVYTVPIEVKDTTQSGTTAQRDVAYPSPSGGDTWDNTTKGYREYYDAADPTGGDDGDGWKRDMLSLDGVIQSVSGTRTKYILDLQDIAASSAVAGTGVADADDQRLTDAVGWRAFRVIPVGSAPSNVLGILFGWSTVAGDLANINSRLIAADYALSNLATAAGVAVDDVGLIVPNLSGAVAATSAGELWTGDKGWIINQDGTTFKTIAVGSYGAAASRGCIVEVIR